MNLSDPRGLALSDAADHAYRRARSAVFDNVKPGAPIDMSRLAPHQRDAIARLQAAEAELADYRSECRDRQVLVS
jgi:hypothetical protein